ncbi:hypothetical protein [Streptomyces sp. 8N616]|uniref:hypothetical protein n=1 Tax=Streptomyces sp. 8N616 TaxID=3457414 RepID=UPI003FD6B232
MLDDACLSAAAAAGTAMAEATVTEAWHSIRSFAARLLSRGDARAEQEHLARLDRDMAALAESRDARTRIRLEAAWQTRFEMLLETAPDGERTELAAELRQLVRLRHDTHAATAPPGPVPHAPLLPGAASHPPRPPGPLPHSPPPPVSAAPTPPPRAEGTPSLDGAGDAPSLVGSIPAEAGPFRHRAEADLLDTLFDEPSATWALVGPAGVGKTRLAAHLARRVLLDGAADLVV